MPLCNSRTTTTTPITDVDIEPSGRRGDHAVADQWRRSI
jgi:hypothetical protein